MQIRRGSDTHSDFVDKLIEAASVIEFEKMTLEEFVIHLFIRDADQTMGKMAQEILKDAKPDINNLVNKIKEFENESWYNNKKEYSRMVSSRPPRYCKPCDSKTHDESQCWGECLHCGQRGHQSSHCIYKQNRDQKQSIPQTGRADKAAPKGKNKKNRRTGKRVAVNDKPAKDRV